MIEIPTGFGLSPVHEIVSMFARALDRLGAPIEPSALERASFLVHEAMAGSAREFHTHEHVLHITEDADPIGTLAGCFHDVVYVQVDQGILGPAAEILRPLLEGPGPKFRVTEAALADATAALVLGVFGKRPGDELTPYSGLNELASALVAAKALEGALSPRHILEVAACIEATMAFRPDPVFEALAARLTALGLDEATSEAAVRRAVRLANRDVVNFSDANPARFLDNTWKLLPETNPALYTPSVYTLGAYRSALQKMEGFLSGLGGDRVFHAFRGVPAPEEHAHRVAQADRNIALAVRYLRTKLYSIALIEALAVVSGGDGPIDYFLGVLPGPGVEGTPLRAEHFLPTAEGTGKDLDPMLVHLLEDGRPGTSIFDIPTSPSTSFLYRSFGERELMERVEQSRGFMRGEASARAFLTEQASAPVCTLARAIARVAFPRRAELERLAATLDG